MAGRRAGGSSAAVQDMEPLVCTPRVPCQACDVEDSVAVEQLGPSRGRRLGRAAVAAALLAGCLIGAVCSSVANPGTRGQHRFQFIGLSAAAPKPDPTTSPELTPPSAPNVLAAARELLPWDEAARRAEELEANLTGEELAGLLHGEGFNVVGNFVGVVNAIPRLGIPALKMQDSGEGFRPLAPGEFGTVTSWPSSLALAAAWDEGMVLRVGRAIGQEFRAKGANVILGPGVNTHRTPYGGRNFEYLSGEDPYLGSRLAAAYVKAVQREGVMAVVKHFAFNEQETERYTSNSMPSERETWELYYPPFEAAIRAGAGAFMCSYNKVNGTQACSSDNLLLRDLKQRMGFAGFVMSDWGAAHSTKDVENGLDMEQPTADNFKKGKLDDAKQASVREAARRILASIFHLRLDENPGCTLPCEEERKSNVRTEAHLKLAEEAATGSVVLLKNDGVLPLDGERVRTLAVLGPAARARDIMNTWGPGSTYSGGGSGHVAAPHVVTALQGIKERAFRSGITVLHDGSGEPKEDSKNASADASAELDLDVDAPEAKATEKSKAEAKEGKKTTPQLLRIADKADAVVVVAGSTTTESEDRATLALDDDADELITALAKQGRPVIVLMEAPGAMLTPWRGEVSALACLFLGGEVTGRAWASILFGDAEPAGKLPITLPASETGAIKPGTSPDVPYSEGVFTSYRSASLKPAFPFGFGLTYTRFELGRPSQVTRCPEPGCVEMTVTNVGQRAGSEVVQAYLVFDPSLKQPAITLRGFHRTGKLQPGESELVRFVFTARDLSIYVVGRGWVQQEWVVARIGTSSEDLQHLVAIRTSMPVKMLQ